MRWGHMSRIILTAEPVPGPREAAMPEREIQAELPFLRSPALIRGVLGEHEREVDGFEPGWDEIARRTEDLSVRLAQTSGPAERTETTESDAQR